MPIVKGKCDQCGGNRDLDYVKELNWNASQVKPNVPCTGALAE